MIKTGKVKDRRRLKFSSPDEVLADMNRIAAAERAGKVRRTGNWTTGQNFNHLATWIEFGYNGNPLVPSWFIKFVLGKVIGKKRFLQGRIRAGVNIPGVPNGTLGTDEMPLDEALAKLQRAWDRLKNEAPSKPNPIFGPLTHEEWKQLHMRHAELHLSFLHPEG
jgi:hypothetical protein